MPETQSQNDTGRRSIGSRHTVVNRAFFLRMTLPTIAQKIMESIDASDTACYYYWHFRAKQYLNSDIIDRDNMRRSILLTEREGGSEESKPEWHFWAQTVYSHISLMCETIATHTEQAEIAAGSHDTAKFHEAHRGLKEATGDPFFGQQSLPYHSYFQSDVQGSDSITKSIVTRMLHQIRQAIRCMLPDEIDSEDYDSVMDELARLADSADEAGFHQRLREVTVIYSLPALEERLMDTPGRLPVWFSRSMNDGR